MDCWKNGAPRILVMEDRTTAGTEYLSVLGERGFSVDIAGDGNIALENLQHNHYDLCILNACLPWLDGTEIYQYLAEHRPALNQSVVFTGDIPAGKIPALLEGSEKVYLEKPFTPGELIFAVEMALN